MRLEMISLRSIQYSIKGNNSDWVSTWGHRWGLDMKHDKSRSGTIVFSEKRKSQDIALGHEIQLFSK